jgi:hypothetical protein
VTDLWQDGAAMALNELKDVLSKQISRFQRVYDSLADEDLTDPLVLACSEGLRRDLERRREDLAQVVSQLSLSTAWPSGSSPSTVSLTAIPQGSGAAPDCDRLSAEVVARPPI